MAMTCLGKSKAYIAGQIGVSESTVKSHVRNIYVKCDVHSQQELIDLTEARSQRRRSRAPLMLRANHPAAGQTQGARPASSRAPHSRNLVRRLRRPASGRSQPSRLRQFYAFTSSYSSSQTAEEWQS